MRTWKVGPPLSGLLLLVGLQGCEERARCTASGGDWNDCAVVRAWCIEGRVIPNDGARPMMCEEGCTCPSDAPVWDAEAGCIKEESCR